MVLPSTLSSGSSLKGRAPSRICTGRHMHLDWVGMLHHKRSYLRQLRPPRDCHSEPASVKLKKKGGGYTLTLSQGTIKQ